MFEKINNVRPGCIPGQLVVPVKSFDKYIREPFPYGHTIIREKNGFPDSILIINKYDIEYTYFNTELQTGGHTYLLLFHMYSNIYPNQLVEIYCGAPINTDTEVDTLWTKGRCSAIPRARYSSGIKPDLDTGVQYYRRYYAYDFLNCYAGVDKAFSDKDSNIFYS